MNNFSKVSVYDDKWEQLLHGTKEPLKNILIDKLNIANSEYGADYLILVSITIKALYERSDFGTLILKYNNENRCNEKESYSYELVERIHKFTATSIL